MRSTLKGSMEILRFIGIVLFLFLGFTLITQINSTEAKTDRNYRVGLENNAYIRVMVCLDSIPDEKQTADYRKLCYIEAEKHNNVSLEHFGDTK